MSFWDFLFPPQCPHCGAPVMNQGDWCGRCFQEVLHIRQVPQKFLCALDAVWILSDYRGGVKSMIYDVKFNEKKEQSKGAVPFLLSYNLYVHKLRPDYIIPIPSGEEKKRLRGYNQVDLFFKKWADSLCDDVHYKWFDCLYKMETHRDMWSLTKKERAETIGRAFMMRHDCSPSDLRDTTVLLVDDIFTTGATLEAAARILKESGVKRIEALTLASGSF